MSGKQIEQTFTTSDGAVVPYLLYLPKDFISSKGTEKSANDQNFGLLFFLHGRGESNGPLNLVAKWGPPRLAARGDDLPYIIVSPQCPADDSWSSETQQTRLTELLEHVTATYPIDPNRTFLTGLSMGGFGSWAFIAKHPDRFAAAVIVCGGGDPATAEKLTNTPIWTFHGDQDGAVPYQRTVDMVDAIKAAGGTKIRFTGLEHFGHNTWSAVYATPAVYQWMEGQSNSRDANGKD